MGMDGFYVDGGFRRQHADGNRSGHPPSRDGRLQTHSCSARLRDCLDAHPSGNLGRPPNVVCLMSTLIEGDATQLPLAGRKILIVEDEAPIALNLAAAVAQAGGIVIGPTASVAASFALMAENKLDGALLDIRLRGETSFPLADVLAVLDIPFVFVSGLSSALMPYTHRDRPLFDKPYDAHDVIATLARLVNPKET